MMITTKSAWTVKPVAHFNPAMRILTTIDHFNGELNCELGAFCLSQSCQCDALCSECFGPETLMSTFLESSSSTTSSGLSFEISSFRDEKLRATFINLCRLHLVLDTDCQAPSMGQVFVCFFEAPQILHTLEYSAAQGRMFIVASLRSRQNALLRLPHP